MATSRMAPDMTILKEASNSKDITSQTRIPEQTKEPPYLSIQEDRAIL
jgi:hypothetical protein